MDIRFVKPEELQQLARNVQTAFPSKTPKQVLEDMPYELKAEPGIHEGRYLGCYDEGGSLIGSVMLMDFSLNMRGKEIPMGAMAYVSTNFLHKKEKVAYHMLKSSVNYFADHGKPFACLHPFNPAFYGKMGFGFGNETTMFSPKPCYIRSFGEKSHLFYAEEKDKEELVEFYRSYAKKTHGATIHEFMDPYRIFGTSYVVGCRRKGKITGYLTFDFVEVDHYTDMYHDLAVREIVYEDIETLQEFMTFFASQTDQIERVRIYTYEPYMHLMFENPDSGENRAFDGAIQEIGRRNMGYMVRITDVEKYFAMEDHCEAGIVRPFTLALEVKDTFIERNHRTFYLDICGEHLKLTEESKPDVTLKADIADLSSLVSGAVTLEEMLFVKRMYLSDHSYGKDIQKAIGWSQKPKNYTYF